MSHGIHSFLEILIKFLLGISDMSVYIHVSETKFSFFFLIQNLFISIFCHMCSTGLHSLWVCCPASLCITFKNDEQGMGTADHMISLDYLFSFRSWNQKQIAVPNLKSTKARNDHENQFANGFFRCIQASL